MLIKFLLILAYIGLVFSLVAIPLSFNAENNYKKSQLRQLGDHLKGITRTFPRGKFWVCLIVCSAFIGAYHIQG